MGGSVSYGWLKLKEAPEGEGRAHEAPSGNSH